MVPRRGFMALAGGGLILAAGGLALWATTRDPAQARAAWAVAGHGGRDPRRRALSFAILAPNPHNRQPWIADLSVADEITLYCDPERRLPETDPFDRQITIGLGCFLELLGQAAAADGHLAEVTLFPDGEPQPRLDGRPVARIRLAADASAVVDPLFGQVLVRRSNKEAYDAARSVAAADLERVAKAARTSAVSWTNDAAQVAELRAIAWEAMFTELTNPPTFKESVDLMRIGKAEIEANPDGIELSGALIEALALSGLLSREAILDTSSTAFQQQLPILRGPFETAMAFLWLSTPGNSRADQIAAGRDHVRLNLAATAAGLSMQPFSQALQEFALMQPHYQRMRNALGISPAQTLQMFVRLGYGPEIVASPRWQAETRIRNG